MSLRSTLCRILFVGAASVALLLSPGAIADRIVLKDGTVLEGTITREGDGFVYLETMVGGVKNSRLVLRADIKSIERDSDAGAAPGSKPEPAPASKPEEKAVPAPSPKTPDATIVSDGATRVAFITLEEMVGTYMNAKALERSIEMLEKAKPDVVVLKFNSGGGYGAEVGDLTDAIQDKLKPKYRTVAWIESAISAASMTAIVCEEIYFMKEGNFGGTVGYRMVGERQAKRMDGEELEVVLRQMERISRRGNHDPLIMRAMQVPTDLSVDIDPETGVAVWRNDLQGQYIVSESKGDKILTLNALDALKYRFTRAIADNKDELMKAMNIGEWVEVGKDAEAYQQQYRADVKSADVKINELLSKMSLALQVGQTARARGYLGELRGWVRRAICFEKYYEMNDAWFRNIEEQIRKQAAEQAEREKKGRR